MKKSLQNSIVIKLFIANILILANDNFASNRVNGVAPSQQTNKSAFENNPKILAAFEKFEAENNIVIKPNASDVDKAIIYSRATNLYSNVILQKYNELEKLSKADASLDKMDTSQPLKDLFDRAKYFLSGALLAYFELKADIEEGKKVDKGEFKKVSDAVDGAKKMIRSAYDAIHYFLREYKK